MAEISLARDFPPADKAAWQTLVEEALKGAPFAALRSKTYDGIVIEPLYARAKARPIPGREPGEAWGVMQRIDLPDAKAANAQILDDLNHAANGIVLVFEGAVGDHGYALPANGTAISTALDERASRCRRSARSRFRPSSKDAAPASRHLVKARRD